jgi:DDE family transposase
VVACGSCTLIDAVCGPTTTGETSYAPILLRSLHAGMIVLADRNFGAKDLLADLAATGADALVRLKIGRKPAVLRRLPDGSDLSMLGTLRVGIIECEITIIATAGRRTQVYRLATTLLDHHRYPAGELITLYHQRWEIETAYLELKPSILGGRVLRARTAPGCGAGGLRPAGDLSTAAYCNGRCHGHPRGHRSGPGQLQHLPGRPPVIN